MLTDRFTVTVDAETVYSSDYWADRLRLAQSLSLCGIPEQDERLSLLSIYGYRLAIGYFEVVKSGGVSFPSFLGGLRPVAWDCQFGLLFERSS